MQNVTVRFRRVAQELAYRYFFVIWLSESVHLAKVSQRDSMMAERGKGGLAVRRSRQ